jgi:hypothetical protein
MADSEDPAVVFYTVAAVAKLGLPPQSGVHFVCIFMRLFI